MKTTVEIADTLLADAKRTAAKENMTLRDLIEEGLRRSIEDRRRRGAFRLRRASFKGKGLQADVEPGTWERIREMAYEGRGS